MARIKTLLKNPRIIILLIALLLGLFAVHPNPWNKGVVIKSITKNSAAAMAGFQLPEKITPMSREKIISINNKPISNMQEYYEIINEIGYNQTIQIRTNKKTYKIITRPQIERIELNETETVNITKTIQINQTINGTTQTINKTITKQEERPKIKEKITGVEPIGLRVANAPKSNIRKGLDLEGGTRVLLKPAEKTSKETMELMVDSLKQRLNVYGLADVKVTLVTDRPGIIGEGTQYILVEIAGATEEEVKDLLSKQGKFEAKIGNKTVFKGGKDITYVCKTADCSGIDPNRPCGKNEEGWICGFRFAITLNPEAAKRQAQLTKNLKVIDDVLEEKLILYLDDQQVDELNIAADLKGRAVTDIAITGFGKGPSQTLAMQETLKNMKRLQTILITGSLPVKLKIERMDNISPTLGKEFLKNAIYIGILAIIAVVTIIITVYRKILIAIPIITTALSEVFLILAMAALIGWNLDLAAIAGIILAVGTGVDDQIVITDEVLRKEEGTHIYNWKQKIKRAFFIIFSAYTTTMVAMTPLLFAGAGLIKGFAITTMLGVSIGVLITRPAYAAITEWLLKK
ncbi:hypothetical protein DRJ22_03105 [Candidatus Woesearchaeota archaeon]|nr:MAG: hypothetical protein DRJ22_03105 [Candidatus Woesearchaeota archaeon]